MPAPTTASADPSLPNDSASSDAIQAGRIDWLARWRTLYDEERAQTDAFHATARHQGDHWAGQGARFARAAGRAPQPDAFMRFVLPYVQLGDTVLDVGAGSGRHAVFLAERGTRVVAVEPSATMRDHLVQHLAAPFAERVQIVPHRWPDGEAPMCDIAICSHVIYSVRDIGPFLTSMDAHARRGCFIVAGLRQPSYMLAPFWERVHGVPRLPLPGALECVNVLYQLGIAAQASVIPTRPYTFTDEAEALDDIRWRLGCAANADNDERLTTLINELLERDPNGQLRPRVVPSATLVLWWTK